MTRVLVTLLFLCATLPAQADPPCGAVEVRFKPGANRMQIVVWIEDAAGKVIATPYITRATGTFGLANRPGAALLKTSYGWPYGRRVMVAPIWAHHRDHHYPKVMMGGVCGNSPDARCPDGSRCGGQCEDSTVAYHERVSSFEPYYCPPSLNPDAISCASQFIGSKGAYADPPAFSLYPPRADLSLFNQVVDSPDLLDFKNKNDLVAVSAATPPAGQPVMPPVYWCSSGMPAGDYVAWIELSQESDFNDAHRHPAQNDSVIQWNNYGFQFLGQPSVVYRVPFHYDVGGGGGVSTQYAGYSTWDGSNGTIHPPDATITNKPGTGAGRLLDVSDSEDVYRVKVIVGKCTELPKEGCPTGPGGDDPDAYDPNCPTPAPVTDLALEGGATDIKVTFRSAATGPAPLYYEMRYQMTDAPITGKTFKQQIAGPSMPYTGPDQLQHGEISGLKIDKSYAVAVRAVMECGRPSAVLSHVTQTSARRFVTLSGCFVATAAFGSPLAAQVQALRDWRDRRLLSNPAGRLAAALYAAFAPPLARTIASDEGLRALARAAIAPMIDSIVR